LFGQGYLRFVEAPKGYDGLPYAGIFAVGRYQHFPVCPAGFHFFTDSDANKNDAAELRFAGWLQHLRR
jgi:hypothetical protein